MQPSSIKEGISTQSARDFFSSSYSTISNYYNLFDGGSESPFSRMSRKIKEMLYYLADGYVSIFSFDDYDNNKISSDNKKKDTYFITNKLFYIFSLPFFYYITYNWFFLLVWSHHNKDQPSDEINVLTEFKIYKGYDTFVKSNTIIQKIINPLILYVLEFPLKPLFLLDQLVITIIRNKTKDTNYPIALFYSFFFFILFMNNDFCNPDDEYESNDKDNTSNPNNDSENDLCGDENPNPYSHEDKENNNEKKAKECLNYFYSVLKIICMNIIIIFWSIYVVCYSSEVIFGIPMCNEEKREAMISNMTNKNMTNTKSMSMRDFAIKGIISIPNFLISILLIILIVIFCFLFRLILNLSDFFLDMSVGILLLYIVIYSFFACFMYLHIFSQSEDIYDFFNIFRTVFTKMDEYIEESVIAGYNDPKPTLFTFLFTREKLLLIYIFLLISIMIQTFLKINSFHLRLITGCGFFFISFLLFVYKFYQSKKNMDNL